MNNLCKRTTAILMVFMIVVSLFPLTVSAGSSDYMTVSRNKSFNKDGKHWTSYNVKNIDSYCGLRVIGEYLSPSGKVLKSFTNYVDTGKSVKFDYPMSFSGLASGTYTFKLKINPVHPSLYNFDYLPGKGDVTYVWKNNITHKAPVASVEYKSYETYYNDKGKLMHKVNITCKNMKGQRLYCKVYDSEGYEVYTWGTETPKRKSNDEVGYFAWSGVASDADGTLMPSGNYTFVISNSANNKVIQKTIWLNIPQGGRG